MKTGPWNIGKDNKLTANPYELHRLKQRQHLTDRTLHVECPEYQEVDQQSAKFVAQLALSSAIIGGCSKILVKGQRWKWEFDVKDLNGRGKWWSKRQGMAVNPLELQQTGSFFDETRQLYQVPKSFNIRESVKFPAAEARP